MDCNVKLFVSGDFCPAKGASGKLLRAEAPAAAFGDFCDLIQDADLSITNLECPLTSSHHGIAKVGPNLKASPEFASILKSAGFDLVTLANNHIYDCGQQGLSDTLESLRQNSLLHVGAGLDLSEAKKTLFIEIRGIKLAIVNFAEIEFSSANSDHGGANPMDLIDNIHQIQDARHHADHVLVIIHGGHEHYHYPSPDTLRRYRFYAENGASAVIGHHTHCIGGYEVRDGVPIFYSLGNFFFPPSGKMSDSWHEGYAVLLTVSKRALEFEILPYEQCQGGTLTISRKRSAEIAGKIESINQILNNEARLAAEWENYTRSRELLYLAHLSGFPRYKIAILRRLGLLKYFYRKVQLRFALSVIRCEAHREAIQRVLSNYLKR